jgi:hypothetical protein
MIAKKAEDDGVQEITGCKQCDVKVQILHHFQKTVWTEPDPIAFLPIPYYFLFSLPYLSGIIQAFGC